MRALSPLVAVTVTLMVLVAGCGSSDGDPLGVPAVDEGSTPPDNEPPPDEDEPEPDPEPEPEGAHSRQDYVDAVVDNLSDAPPGMFDADCMANRTVDAVTLEALVAADVDPVEFGDAENMVAIGLEPTPAMRAGFAEALEDCFDTHAFTLEILAELGLGFPDEILQCVAESMAPMVNTSLALEFIDGTADFGPDNFADSARIGSACASDLAADAPGSRVAWADGSAAFTAGLVERLSTPLFEGALAIDPSDAQCFSARVVDILGPVLAVDLTVGDLASYLTIATAPADIGLVVDEPTAVALADASLGCIDPFEATTAASLLGMSAFMDVTDAMAAGLEACFRGSVSDDVWIESLTLQFLHGIDSFDHPAAIAINTRMMGIGEDCALEAIAAG